MIVPSARAARFATAFAALFAVSGACGLVYEVVWTRLLVAVFGVTGFAVSTVLASFMGGLALGAALLGGRADASRRPLRMFAILEGGVALCALAMPAALSGVEAAYDALAPALGGSFAAAAVARLVLCAAVLLVPTVLMGGTLPALARGLLSHDGRLGRGLAMLYFVNTAGAAAGCYAAGFHLLPALGLARTTWLAAAGSALVAFGAWLLDREREPRAAEAEGSFPEEDACRPAWWPLAVAGASGFAALLFEVAWFRLLVTVFGSTTYSFSAMLAIFLLGIAVGSLAAGSWAERTRRPVRVLAGIELAAGAAVVAGYLVVNHLPRLFLGALARVGIDYAGMSATKLALSALTILPPALAFGAAFPAVVRLAQAAGIGAGRGVGRAYAWNTVGCIAGSFGGGFVLIPAIGAERALEIVAVTCLAAGLGTVLADREPLHARWAGATGLAFVLLAGTLGLAPRWDRRLLGVGAYFEPRQFYAPDGSIIVDRRAEAYTLAGYREGFSDTIFSYLSAKGKFITVNGSPTASDQMEDMVVQGSLGHFPALMHAGPVRSACVVGLGVGVTAGAIASYGVERVEVVELERGVFDSCRMFAKENHGVLDDPHVRVRIDDARGFLRTTRETFDVIASEPNFPSLSGAGQLYNREFLEICRRRLAPGGIMCHWSPLWRLDASEVRRIVGTFASVFPHVRVYWSGLCLVLLGGNDPFPRADWDGIARRMALPEASRSLREIGIETPGQLLAAFQMDDAAARAWSAGIAPSTDDRPLVEFETPRWLFAETVGSNLASLRAARPSLDARLAALGLDAERSGEVRRAAEAVDEALDGEILLGERKLEPAIDALAAAARAGHRWAGYRLAETAARLGNAAQGAGDLAAAHRWFTLGLEGDADNLEALAGAGYVDVFLGDLSEADRLLARAAELYPRSGVVAWRLGVLRDLQGRPSDAAALYARAMALEPYLPQPYGLLGRSRLAEGKAAEASALFETALRLGDDTEGVAEAHCQALFALGRGEDALACARRAADAFPASSDALGLLAELAQAAGRTEEAAEARRKREALLERARP